MERSWRCALRPSVQGADLRRRVAALVDEVIRVALVLGRFKIVTEERMASTVPVTMRQS